MKSTTKLASKVQGRHKHVRSFMQNELRVLRVEARGLVWYGLLDFILKVWFGLLEFILKDRVREL